jgi:hypothetical protein
VIVFDADTTLTPESPSLFKFDAGKDFVVQIGFGRLSDDARSCGAIGTLTLFNKHGHRTMKSSLMMKADQ